MEKVTNVVADKINGGTCSRSRCHDPALNESAEVVSRTPADLELATVPRQLFNALGDLDNKSLRHLLDTHIDENCIYVTQNWDQPIIGRDNIYQFLIKFNDRTPDAIRTVRHARVVVDEAGNKAVKFKTFETGTYIPDTSGSDDAKAVPNPSISSLISRLDESCVSKREIASIKESFAGKNDATSFSFLGHSAFCWCLSGQGKAQRIEVHTKVLSIKPVAVAWRGIKK
jgi:hypothetical protein